MTNTSSGAALAIRAESSVQKGSRKQDRDAELQSLVSEDLARVHDIMGVDCVLDCTHDAHCLAVLGN